jgi:hypothetical protein
VICYWELEKHEGNFIGTHWEHKNLAPQKITYIYRIILSLKIKKIQNYFKKKNWDTILILLEIAQ